MKKTKISLLLVLCLALLMGSIPPNTDVSAEANSALPSDSSVQVTAYQDKYFYGDPADGIEIVQVWRSTDDGLVEASIEDVMREHAELETLKSEIENSTDFNADYQLFNNDIRPMIMQEIYEETTNYEFRQIGERVSLIQENRGPGSDSQNLPWNASARHTFSPEFSIAAIRFGVSYTFESSGSQSGSSTLTLEPCYRGWFVFDPRMRRSMGTMKYYDYDTDLLIGSTPVNGAYPTKVGNTLDGWMYSVKQKMGGCTPR